MHAKLYAKLTVKCVKNIRFSWSFAPEPAVGALNLGPAGAQPHRPHHPTDSISVLSRLYCATLSLLFLLRHKYVCLRQQ